MEWLFSNKEWLFSGLGVTVLVSAVSLFFKNRPKESQPAQNITQNVSQTVSISVDAPPTSNQGNFKIEQLKSSTKILFIDDDKAFKIVDILKRMGWINTKLIKDINSLSDANVLSANVLFIDIQGVGKLLQEKDEGLGLALSIKRRYPEKIVVIYSAQEDGARFHEALSEADYSLPKNASPIRFEETIIKVLSK